MDQFNAHTDRETNAQSNENTVSDNSRRSLGRDRGFLGGKIIFLPNLVVIGQEMMGIQHLSVKRRLKPGSQESE